MKPIKQKHIKKALHESEYIDILDIAGKIEIRSKTKIKSVLKARNEIHKRYSRI